MTVEAGLIEGAAWPDGPGDPLQLQAPVLVPFGFWLPQSTVTADQAPRPPAVAALSAAITAHLAGLGWPGVEPLRWAITAVDPNRGLQLEGVGISGAGACWR